MWELKHLSHHFKPDMQILYKKLFQHFTCTYDQTPNARIDFAKERQCIGYKLALCIPLPAYMPTL